MRDESKNGGGMRDGRNFNSGMRGEERIARPGYAPFRRRDRGYDEYWRDHNLAQGKSQLYLRYKRARLINRALKNVNFT